MQKRPTRTIKKPSRYAAVASEIKETVLQHEKDKLVETRVEDRAVRDFSALHASIEDLQSGTIEVPRSQTMTGPDRGVWRKAEQVEMDGIRARGVYEVVDKKDVPKGYKITKTRFVLTQKPTKKKARLVVQDYGPNIQVNGVTVETFSPTTRSEVCRAFLACAAGGDRVVYKGDFSQAFLYADLEEEVYVYSPDELEVWRLRKALYGLKQDV